MNVSGNTASSTPSAAARAIAPHTRSIVPAPVVMSGAICTAAALLRFISHRPGIDNRCARLLVHKNAVQDVQRVDRDYPRDKGFFRLAVQGLGGEPTAVDLASFLHKLCEALIDEEMPWKCFVAERRESALEPERNAGAVKKDGSVVSFAEQACSGQGVDDADRPFERDGVKRDERFFTWIGFDVWKDFLFVVYEKISGFM